VLQSYASDVAPPAFRPAAALTPPRSPRAEGAAHVLAGVDSLASMASARIEAEREQAALTIQGAFRRRHGRATVSRVALGEPLATHAQSLPPALPAAPKYGAEAAQQRTEPAPPPPSPRTSFASAVEKQPAVVVRLAAETGTQTSAASLGSRGHTPVPSVAHDTRYVCFLLLCILAVY
jgi:hypothetical protein